MKVIAAVAAVLPIVAGFTASPSAHAQDADKKPVKAVPADKNRVTRTDLGISYVVPPAYIGQTPPPGVSLMMEGPRPTSYVAAGNYQEGNVHITINRYLETVIFLAKQPADTPTTPPFDINTDTAKMLLDAINSAHLLGNNPFNYQNSAKITVDHHDAMAILAEITVPGGSQRAFVRLIFLLHRGRLYTFVFGTIDTDFEDKVPAFESFMNSVRFLLPNIVPTENKSGPIQIQIGH